MFYYTPATACIMTNVYFKNFAFVAGKNIAKVSTFSLPSLHLFLCCGL
jgi:hypothetical protein